MLFRNFAFGSEAPFIKRALESTIVIFQLYTAGDRFAIPVHAKSRLGTFLCKTVTFRIVKTYTAKVIEGNAVHIKCFFCLLRIKGNILQQLRS